MSDDDDNDGMVIMDDEDLQHVQKGEHKNDTCNDGDDEDDAEELVFDPVLQCFYSPRTNMYYESK
jgi:hypothetical protein